MSDKDLDLNESSLHWVAGPSNLDSHIALPSSGTASYDVVGHTPPTDNLGNVGIFGGATLDANFNTMTVDSTVNVGFDSTNQNWSGSATGMPIDVSGQYGGAMTVDVAVDADGSQFTGTGSASGFFTNNAAGSGMTYSLDADIGGTATSVSGAAVVEQK